MWAEHLFDIFDSLLVSLTRIRLVQDWFFRPRQRVNTSGSQACCCHRCHTPLRRSNLHFVDVGKMRQKVRVTSKLPMQELLMLFLLPQMEELCHPCMVVVVRHHVGGNEADIERRAADIMHWVPCIDPKFAEAWIVHRTYFHDALL